MKYSILIIDFLITYPRLSSVQIYKNSKYFLMTFIYKVFIRNNLENESHKNGDLDTAKPTVDFFTIIDLRMLGGAVSFHSLVVSRETIFTILLHFHPC